MSEETVTARRFSELSNILDVKFNGKPKRKVKT